jgi:hypothetical protein
MTTPPVVVVARDVGAHATCMRVRDISGTHLEGSKDSTT